MVLIKPQFEAGREKVGKKGVVRDPAVHREVIRNVITFSREEGYVVMGLDYSPIRGPEGNIEYLLWLRPAEEAAEQSLQRLMLKAEEADMEKLLRMLQIEEAERADMEKAAEADTVKAVRLRRRIRKRIQRRTRDRLDSMRQKYRILSKEL